MKTISTFLVMAMMAIIPSNIVSSEEQGGGGALAQAAWNPNQMEPLKRQARQWTGILRGGGGLGGGMGQEAWACGILCPDDDAGFIPYRAPRPTKGSFVPIRG